jgi:hypothetical protein
MSREVTLVLTDGVDVFGTLPPFQVGTPWWAEVAVVIDAAHEITGDEVVILRLLEASTTSSEMGGRVTYLAEVNGPPKARLTAWTGPDPLEPQRNRAWWAEAGALAEAVAWARAVLGAAGIDVLEARQQRSWNLSVLVQLETSQGLVWLKAVPAFLADEGLVLRNLSVLDAAIGMLPTVLAHDPTRRMALLADVPGEDFWHASATDVVVLGKRLLDLHREGYECGLLPAVAGDIADRTAVTLAAELEALIRDGLPDGLLDPDSRSHLARLSDEVPTRLAPLRVLPDVVVHGDPHPGNWRAGPHGQRVLLDWGDVAVASPLTDVGALFTRLPAADIPVVRRSLEQELARAFGRTDVSAAMAALPLLHEVNAAVSYARFCRGIEPDERVYHRDDVTACLRAAFALIAGTGR